MTNEICSIAIDKFVPHPDNPNRMSKANFAKLVRNIERTGRYEPLVVRPYPDKLGYVQIINGYHRWQALKELGYKTADAVVWDIDDQQADILLTTLNRLGGCDILEKKLALLNRLTERMRASELAKLLPQTAKQIERLTNLKFETRIPKVQARNWQPMVFFVTQMQQETIEKALSNASQNLSESTKAGERATALTYIAQFYINQLGVSSK